jgi:hypothetical protein
VLALSMPLLLLLRQGCGEKLNEGLKNWLIYVNVLLFFNPDIHWRFFAFTHEVKAPCAARNRQTTHFQKK